MHNPEALAGALNQNPDLHLPEAGHLSSSADSLAALGWDAAFAADFAALAGDAADAVPGRVVVQQRGRFRVATARGEVSAVLAGRLRHAAADADALPAVGDWVALAARGEGDAVIMAVLPRRGAFRRKAAGQQAAGQQAAAQVVAANVDVALVVAALPGGLNPHRLERYLALAWESGAIPIVVLTKADLSDDVEAARALARAHAPGAEVLAVSCVTGDGVDSLASRLPPGRTAVLLGVSGAGKSTLVNALAGREMLRTAEVRGDGKGRHTTTHRELVRLAGGALLIDTPGMRELALWDADHGLSAVFGEVEALAEACRFADCAHQTEPGCAVLAAVEEGRVDAARVEHWRSLRRELAYLDRRRDEAAASAERGRHRVSQRALRAHIRRKYGE